MIVVTGGAGFIGSCLVARLNDAGHEDVVVVDHMGQAPIKKCNLEQKRFSAYYDKKVFLDKLLDKEFDGKLSCIIHMGACSSTTGTDAQYYEENNFLYTRHLAKWCLDNNVRFIYASSAATYGDGSQGYDDDPEKFDQLTPLNLYGESKHKFDLWARDEGVLDKMVGLKFFNVFGPNEYHKGDMRSVINKAYPRVAEEGVMGLFKSYHPNFDDGDQKRDFIYIKDAVDMVIFFFENTDIGGIFNVGTGKARSWNDVAYALFAAVGKEPHIEYINMPEQLRGKYQYFTQARMTKIKAVGYEKPIISLEDAVKDYVQYLSTGAYI